MMQIVAENREAFLQVLQQELLKKLSHNEAEQITQFARQYYAMFPMEELNEKSFDDLYGAVLSCWHFIQDKANDAPKIRVFNPSLEENGWQSTHTIIEILTANMPFVVDSVRMEINRRLITIHTIQNDVFLVDRKNQRHLTELAAMQANENLTQPSQDGYQQEILIYLEIDRHSDNKLLQDIEAELLTVLDEVKQAVGDFHKINQIVEEIVTDLDNNPPPLLPEEISETKEFLLWLISDHFTFLGYEETCVANQGSEKIIKRIDSTGLGVLRDPSSRYIESRIPNERLKYLPVPQLLTFVKSPIRCRIHRPAYPDYIIIKEFDEKGSVIGEKRILGLYTSPVYTQSPRQIPIIRHKVNSVIQRSRYPIGSHNWKELFQILEVFPRDELFQISSGELLHITVAISQIQERRHIRLFIRRNSYGNFFAAIVFIPRDIYSTDLRKKIQEVLCDGLQVKDVEFTTYFSESILARTYFVLRVDPEALINFDTAEIETKIIDIARSWSDKLYDALVDRFGEENGNSFYQKYINTFPVSYQENFNPNVAVVDIEHIEGLTEKSPIDMSFYHPVEYDDNLLHFKLFHRHISLSLSDIMPIFENFGLRVLSEHPYKVACSDQHCSWIHDFSLMYEEGDIDAKKIKTIFSDAFLKIWQDTIDNDSFNRLLVKAYFPWNEIGILRCYARYNRQLCFGFSQTYLSDTLCKHIFITGKLIELFNTAFDPEKFSDLKKRKTAVKNIKTEIIAAIDDVDSLDEDRILRRFLELILATVRTNYFQMPFTSENYYLSFKVNPQAIKNIPLPKPLFEIYVYSKEVEGVHLRSGNVSRGGLRWSDRPEDFRTEVLGLVKAQQVKNAVIVPMGAKGGFIVKNPVDNNNREAWLKQGIHCYKLFIKGLLDITDNLKADDVLPPEKVFRWDDNDPYLVVAADKGTATFSDIANELSINCNFWLGDAFASGGSAGYDHKKMGITARGGWVSVERHFKEMDVDIHHEDFTVVGIGDMSGDVFGNGMLLSKHIQLLAAFNHQSIFIDPNPDASQSYIERQRLFNLPRSNWTDYDLSVISEGGGIFSRSLKSITITKQIQERFNIKSNKLTPVELISILLKAPVDLIWNGGIGTYVKASNESHSDVGDKTNDTLRVDANELNCKVIGEGGNLGLTQLARIEYALSGGKINTDFIDNAAGVDCSDHEVNIKILLDELIEIQDLTLKQRNQFLAKMEEEVADLVLKNNYRQTQALTLAELNAEKQLLEYQRYMHKLEQAGKLNRDLEFLPSDEVITERKAKHQGLTRPELSVLLAYAKLDLKQSLLLDDNLIENKNLLHEATTAFPSILAKKYHKQIYHHRLIREIVATQLANGIINRMGINYIQRMLGSTGASVYDVTLAYVAANCIFSTDKYWNAIESLDYKVSSKIQQNMMLRITRLLRRSSRWLLRNRRREFILADIIEQFSKNIQDIQVNLSDLLVGQPRSDWESNYNHYQSQSVPDELAQYMSNCDSLYSILCLVDASRALKLPLKDVVKLHFQLGEHLELYEFEQLISELDVENHWQALARESFRDDMEWQQRALTERILKRMQSEQTIEEVFNTWLDEHETLISRWKELLSDFANADKRDFAMGIVTVRSLLDLAQAL